MENTKIEWCNMTFNHVEGCSKVSAGCANCYAETRAKRFGSVVWGPNGTRRVASESYWKEPLKWDRQAAAALEQWRADSYGTPFNPPYPKPERPRVFCASLADVFEDWKGAMVDARGERLYYPNNSWEDHRAWIGVSDCGGDERPITMNDVRARLFRLIDATPNLDWLLLTKRPENIVNMMPGTGWVTETDRAIPVRKNVWYGTSVENQATADERIPHLLKVPAAVRFLSCEPLLGHVDITYPNSLFPDGPQFCCSGHECNCMGMPIDPPPWLYPPENRIDWVIVGGESGPGARPCDLKWIRDIVRQCKDASVPVFVKQLGAMCGESSPSGESVRAWGETKVVNADDGVRYLLGDKKGGDLGEWADEFKVREFPTVRS